MRRKTTSKMKAVEMFVDQLLFEYQFTQPKGFPEEISLVRYDVLYGLFCNSSNSLLSTISYQKIVYDPGGHNFLGYHDGETNLINLKGKVIFSTYEKHLPSDEVHEYLITIGDGTYQYITNNAMNGQGWYSLVNRKGKIITKSEHYL